MVVRQSAATKRKLRAIHVERARQRAEADPAAAGNLRLARLRAGHSWPTLAEAAGVSESVIARAESPTRAHEVGDWTWKRLARALNVEPDEIKP